MIAPAAVVESARVTGIVARDKIFDGSATAGLDTSGVAFTGRLGADQLTVATATGAFTDADLGLGKTVAVTGIVLGGADAANYRLVDATAQTTASIIAPPTGAAVNAVTAAAAVPVTAVRDVPILGIGPRLNPLRLGEPVAKDGDIVFDSSQPASETNPFVCPPGLRPDAEGVCRPI